MRVLAVLLTLLLAVPAWAEVPSLAVMDLSNDTGDAKLDGAGAGMAGVLVGKLARTGAVQLVERQRLEEVLAEIELGQSGAVDPKTAAKTGRIVGADYVVLGSLFSLELPNLAVVVRVVEVESGDVVATDEVRIGVGDKGEKLFVLLDEMARRLVEHLDLELDPEARLELGQIDVRRLETVEAYGRGLEALDDGDVEAAQGFFGRAVAYEPEFALAEAALEALAGEVAERRSTYSDETLTQARALFDSLRTATEGPKARPTAEDIARLAVRARVQLVQGDLDAYVATEEERVALTREAMKTVHLLKTYPDDKPTPEHPWSHAVQIILKGGRKPGVRAFDGLVFRPWEVEYQVADVLLRAGRRDAAVERYRQTYRDPGPLRHKWAPPGEATMEKPEHPLVVFRDAKLWSETLVLVEQELRLWELAGDPEQIRAFVSYIDQTALPAVAEAQRARKALEDLEKRLGRGKVDVEGLDAERAALSLYAEHPDRVPGGYAAFVRRVDGGAYDRVRDSRVFAEVARRWRELADSRWEPAWGAERRLQHLLTLHEQVPGDDREARRRELQSLVEEAFSE